MSNLNISRAERLDMRVIAMLPQLTRSAASRLIGEGKVTVNGTPVQKSGHKLRKGDSVSVDFDPQMELAIPDIDLPVIYEEDECVVVDKPIGVLTHSKGVFNPEATVASWLGYHLARQGKNSFIDLDKDVASGSPDNPRAGIVHRLDRATSGVIILAKTPAALSWLQKQFSQRKTKKTYRAIVYGRLSQPEAIIDMPIERNPKRPQTFRVGANGKAAQTRYKVDNEFQTTNGTCTTVDLMPVTGRTHQLRVHMAHLGHPIIGDTLYKGIPAARLFLHAASLEITLPSGERKVFSSPIPQAFDDYMSNV